MFFNFFSLCMFTTLQLPPSNPSLPPPKPPNPPKNTHHVYAALRRRFLNTRRLTRLNPPNQIACTQPRRPRHRPSDPYAPRVTVVLVVFGVGPAFEVLLSEGYDVDLVFVYEFFCYSEAGGVGDYLKTLKQSGGWVRNLKQKSKLPKLPLSPPPPSPNLPS